MLNKSTKLILLIVLAVFSYELFLQLLPGGVGSPVGLLVAFFSAIFVFIDNKKTQTNKYKTRIISSPYLLFLSVYLFWIIFFPWYIWLRTKIKRGELELREEHEEVGRFKNIARQLVTGSLKFFLSIAMIISFFSFFVLSLNVFWGDDLEILQDEDFLPVDVFVPNEDNSFFDLEKIEEVYEPEAEKRYASNFLYSDSWDDELASSTWEKNREALQYFTDAASKNYYQVPTLATKEISSSTFEIYPLNNYRKISRVSVSKAIWLASKGDVENSYKEAFKSVVLGHKMMESQNSLIGYLVGMSIKKNGLNGIQRILILAETTPSDKEYIARELEKYSVVKDDFSRYKFEYVAKKRAFDDISREFDSNNTDPSSVYYFKPNLTVSHSLNRLRLIVDESKKECYERVDVEAEETIKLDNIYDYFKLLKTENVIGELLRSLGVVSLNNVERKTCELEEDVLLTKLLLSIKSFYDNEGALPEDITNLYPTYVQATPKDTFVDSEYIYKPTEKMLYSVGVNKVDDGGCLKTKNESCFENDDLVINLNFKIGTSSASNEAVE
ncbi:hypothetical protein C0584_05560 [Candidatus Parcubacteria bacterium]|nr:MAG: hypothetical protein C0584_05560 [Candidatus Parcubacteria bacterium]